MRLLLSPAETGRSTEFIPSLRDTSSNPANRELPTLTPTKRKSEGYLPPPQAMPEAPLDRVLDDELTRARRTRSAFHEKRMPVTFKRFRISAWKFFRWHVGFELLD